MKFTLGQSLWLQIKFCYLTPCILLMQPNFLQHRLMQYHTSHEQMECGNWKPGLMGQQPSAINLFPLCRLLPNQSRFQSLPSILSCVVGCMKRCPLKFLSWQFVHEHVGFHSLHKLTIVCACLASHCHSKPTSVHLLTCKECLNMESGRYGLSSSFKQVQARVSGVLFFSYQSYGSNSSY